MNLGHINNFEIKIERISRCGAHFSDNPEFGHFMSTCCFAEDGKEMYQELLMTYVHSFCSPLVILCLVTLPLQS